MYRPPRGDPRGGRAGEIEQRYRRLPILPHGDRGKLFRKCSVCYPTTLSPFFFSGQPFLSRPGELGRVSRRSSTAVIPCRSNDYHSAISGRTENSLDTQGDVWIETMRLRGSTADTKYELVRRAKQDETFSRHKEQR